MAPDRTSMKEEATRLFSVDIVIPIQRKARQRRRCEQPELWRCTLVLASPGSYYWAEQIQKSLAVVVVRSSNLKLILSVNMEAQRSGGARIENQLSLKVVEKQNAKVRVRRRLLTRLSSSGSATGFSAFLFMSSELKSFYLQGAVAAWSYGDT